MGLSTAMCSVSRKVCIGVNHTTGSGISVLLVRKEGVSKDNKHSGKDRRTEAGSVGRRQTAWQRFTGLKGDGLFARQFLSVRRTIRTR